MSNGLGDGYEKQKLYKVTKIFDKRAGKECSYVLMCGQAAIPSVPADKHIEMYEKGGDEYKEWLNDAKWEDVWKRQETFEPMLGWPVYFRSIKMDAGWHRTSVIEKIELLENGDIIIETVGSKHLVQRVDSRGRVHK